MSNKAKSCYHCGLTISGKNSKFCSYECRRTYYGALPQQEYVQKNYTKMCDVCGSTFVSHRKRQLRCSYQCSFQAQIWYHEMRINEELTASLRWSVLTRDNFQCCYCGATPPNTHLHVDHIIPVVKGGTNDLDNLITSCEECNLGKHIQVLDEKHAVLVGNKKGTL